MSFHKVITQPMSSTGLLVAFTIIGLLFCCAAWLV